MTTIYLHTNKLYKMEKQKFEYCEVKATLINLKVEDLNKLGEEGWLLVSQSSYKEGKYSGVKYIFAREK